MTVNDGYVAEAPHPQHAVDLFKGNWTSALPLPALKAKAGTLNLFDDDRIHWLIGELGGVDGADILELGPLEGGHTSMMHASGARSVLAIEANTTAYMKCLIVKELLGLDRARFLLGDFVGWLQENDRQWDLIVASGVLYHMVDPVHLLELISSRTNRLFLWTHVFDADAMPECDERRQPIIGVEEQTWQGMTFRLYRRTHLDTTATPTFCGGVHAHPAWLEKTQLLDILHKLQFSDIRIAFNAPNHPAGPSLCILAQR